MIGPQPYGVTPEFTESSLPAKLRCDHATKSGVWGVIRVLDGRLRLAVGSATDVCELGAGETAVVEPEQVHAVEPLGPVRMQVEFHHVDPRGVGVPVRGVMA